VHMPNKNETVTGSTPLRSGENVSSKSGYTLAYDWVEAWDYRLRQDLDHLIRNVHPKWERAEEYVRNAGSGSKEGNLVAEFIKTLHARLLAKELNVHVESDNPEFSDHAERAEVVAQAVQRIADLIGALRDAATPATWASFGVLEVGHPIDPASHDPWMSYRNPNYDRDDSGVADQWEEVPAEDLEMFGADPEKVLPFSEQQRLELEHVLKGDALQDAGAPGDPAAPMEQPRPVFRPNVGYPWVQSVDPRLIIIPTNAKSSKKLSYVARLRFISRAELMTIQGYDAGPGSHVNGHYRTLFDKTEEDGGLDLYPEMCLIAEVYIRRDRNNPQFNNWFFSYIFGEPGKVIRHGPNQHGGMSPLIFLKLDPLKNMHDLPLASELIKFADIYDMGVRSMMETLERSLNRKTLISNGAGMDDPEQKKYFDPKYRGPVKLQDINAIKEDEGPSYDIDLIRGMTFVKSLAQSNTGQSDIDRGTAIKEITARQTQALLDATGINIETMAAQMSKAAMEAVMKLMHLAGLFSMVGRDRKFQFGGRFTSMQRGNHDFTTSYIYDVSVEDNESAFTAEDRMMWVQFVRTLFSDSQGLMVPYFDREGLAKHTRRVFDAPMSLLASRSAGREGQGINPMAEAGLEAGIPGSLNPALDEGRANMLSDISEGQHPERSLGSRGFDVGNAIRGGMKTGSGTGEI